MDIQSANFAPPSDSPLNAVQFGLDPEADRYRPKFIVQNGVNIYDPTQYQLQNFDIDHSYSPQVNLQAGASYVKRYNWGGHSGALWRSAGRFATLTNSRRTYDITYNLNDPSVAPLSMFPLKQTVTNFYNGSYMAPSCHQLQRPVEFLSTTMRAPSPWTQSRR